VNLGNAPVKVARRNNRCMMRAESSAHITAMIAKRKSAVSIGPISLRTQTTGMTNQLTKAIDMTSQTTKTAKAMGRIVKPTIHLNGTSRESLVTGYRNAYDAIDAAIDMVAKTAPHGRDYYVQSDNAVIVAIAQHQSRLQTLEGLRKELETIILAIMD